MNEKLTLQDVTEKVAVRAGVTKKVADDFLRELFALIVESLDKEGLVKIKGLGTFKLKSVEGRKSVNVQTGAEMVIPAHVKVTYTPDKTMSADVNKPYAHMQTYVLDQDGPTEAAAYEDEEEIDIDLDKMDNSVFVNANGEDGDALGQYYFNDEPVLADQRQEESAEPEAQLSSEQENPTDVKACAADEVPIQPILEAQPQEGQTVTVFTEQGSVLGTPSINPGPVVTLLLDEEETIAEEKNGEGEEKIAAESLSEDNAVASNEMEETKMEENQDKEAQMEANKDADRTNVESSQDKKETVVVGQKKDNQEDNSKKEEKVANLEESDENSDRSHSVNLFAYRLILFLVFVLLALLAYMYKDNLKSLLGLDEKVEVVVPPTVANETVDDGEEAIYDDMSDSHISGGVIQHSDEGTLDDQPVVEEPATEAAEPQYSFAPELVQYMKENYPNEDISISGIKDEVTLTPGRRLVDLSLKYYGHKYFWVYIYFFNADQIKDPNKLVAGTLIKVPELNPSLVDKNDSKKLDMAFGIKKLIEK